MALLSFVAAKITTPLPCDEPGWNNPDCSRLNPAEPYISQICSPEHSTWGASIIQGDNAWFAIASTMVDNNGLTCWPSTSTCGIWMAQDLKGPWKFLSYIGTGNLTTWCHNAYGTIEYKLADPSNLNSKKTAALAIYGLTQVDKKTKNIALANFSNPPAANICKLGRWAKPFPVNSKDQEMVIFYKELTATNDTGIRKELTAILQRRILVANINGYNRNDYVNTEFQSVNLKKRNPFLSINSVNPAPLIDKFNNYAAFYKNAAGQYYRILFYRSSAPVKHHDREVIGSMYMRSDQYPWDDGATYSSGATAKCAWNMEDPYSWLEANNKIDWLDHDGRACGNWNACTAKSSVPLTLDIFNARTSYCNAPKMVSNGYIDNTTTVDYAQRPSLYFMNGKPKLYLRGTVPAKNHGSSCTTMLILT